MDKKLTDNEIVKALKEILEIMLTMGDLQKSATISNTLDLINRQKAEIESWQAAYMTEKQEIANLEIELKAMRAAANSYKKMFDDIQHLEMKVNKIKTEAYKEFAERFVTELVDTYDLKSMQIGNIEKIKNNLLKEMEGGASEVED